jgi:phospholipid/cholesterol/gamma-HCH transport system permease protein
MPATPAGGKRPDTVPEKDEPTNTSAPAALSVDDSRSGTLLVTLSGDWQLGKSLPGTEPVLTACESLPASGRIVFDTTGMGAWDTGLVVALANIEQTATEHGVDIDHAGLPEGATKLLKLAFAVGERTGARRVAKKDSIAVRVGKSSVDYLNRLKESFAFLGGLIASLGRFFAGRANYQRNDLWVTMQEAGAEALPIVGLISFLIGIIFAFVGVIQLNKFGAGIYVADLVAVGMVREMGPIMTGIIMAGRTGAAFAARIGTMKVNEEVDALTTLGLDPMDFLVLPRVIALVLMLPLLTIYANAVGILGGMIVSLTMLDVSSAQYWVQTKSAVGIGSIVTGLIKALVYGIVVAIAGVKNGLACGSSAQAVGNATTSAVVSGIVWIIVSASVLTVIYITLGV